MDLAAVRDLDKLDRQAARRILGFLHGRVAAQGNRILTMPAAGSLQAL